MARVLRKTFRTSGVECLLPTNKREKVFLPARYRAGDQPPSHVFYGDSIVYSRLLVAVMSSGAPPTIPASLQIYKYVQNSSRYSQAGRSRSMHIHLFIPIEFI